MKDKFKIWSSVLVGVKIPDNRVDFYIPILRFFNDAGSKDLDYYVYSVYKVDNGESRFLVLEDPNTLQFYSIKRPVILLDKKTIDERKGNKEYSSSLDLKGVHIGSLGTKWKVVFF